MGRFGRLIEPVLAPLGFDWRIGSALMAGVIAKEMVVAQLGILFAAGDVTEEAAQATLSSRLRETYSPLCALCIMVFCLLSSPCVATLAATWQESRSWRWPVFQVACYTALAYVVTFCVRLAGLVLT
jgi:ferrous iron transport protein B